MPLHENNSTEDSEEPPFDRTREMSASLLAAALAKTRPFDRTREMSASLLAAALAKTRPQPPKPAVQESPNPESPNPESPNPESPNPESRNQDLPSEAPITIALPKTRPFDRTREMPASLLAAALAKTLLKPELPDDALIGKPAPSSAAPKPRPRRLLWLWAALGISALVPLTLTLIGALTSPPHVAGVPNGHLVYLEAEAPSEKTTTLRGLYLTGPDTPSRLLVHENEPQDIDGGVREWVTQPALSPDGTQLAFEKQLITLLDEKQAIQNQIWVMPLDAKTSPHLVMDLTQKHLKQIVGLAWDSDSSLLFLEDGLQYSVPTDSSAAPLQSLLDLHGLALSITPDVSATRNPALTEAGSFAYSVQTPNGPQVLVQNSGAMIPGPASALFALAPTGDRVAFVPTDTSGIIRFYDIAKNQYGPDLKVHWGWSVFGRRHLTSLRWSPDGSQIAFTVSKPPVPEDEIFLVTIASGKTVQLPYRTGQAAWDWGK